MLPEVTVTDLNALTERIIGLAFKVIKELGRGYLEKVYENALAHECRKAGLRVTQQHRLIVLYDGIEVGEYVADMVIEDLVLIEIKAAKAIDSAHEAQCINYLTTTRLPICLILNFNSRVEVRRLAGPSAPRLSVSRPVEGSIPMTWAEQAESPND